MNPPHHVAKKGRRRRGGLLQTGADRPNKGDPKTQRHFKLKQFSSLGGSHLINGITSTLVLLGQGRSRRTPIMNFPIRAITYSAQIKPCWLKCDMVDLEVWKSRLRGLSGSKLEQRLDDRKRGFCRNLHPKLSERYSFSEDEEIDYVFRFKICTT